MKIKYFTVALLLAPIFSEAHAQTKNVSITELFPYAAQSHSKEGELEMDWDSQIIGTRKGELDFNKHDDLNGKCDKGTCRISGKVLAPYSLPTFNHSPFTLPIFNKKNSSVEKECTSWNGQNVKLTDDKYKKIIAGGDCKVSIASSGDVTITENLTVNGSAVLTLQPGNYWVDSLDFSGGAKIMVAPAGEVNFYVKDNINIAISSLGSDESKVNVYHYDDDDITLSGSLAWHGDVQTKGDIKIGGSSKLYGSVQAESIVMSGSAELYLTAGTYWLEELELTGSAKLIPVGNSLTTLYVREEVDLEGGGVQLGEDGQPLLLFVYGDDDGDGDDDGEVDMDSSSRLYGHVYIQGDLDMASSTKIYGAVNVVDLDMESSSLIDYRELKVPNITKIDHYELHFNSCSEELMVKACADNLCSSLYQEKAKLHVKANGSNLLNFNNFIGTESKSIKNNKLNYPFTMVVQSDGKGGNMDPEAENPLVCYVDGARSCTVNKPDGNAEDSSFTLSVDTTYAADKGPIQFSGNCLASNATVETELSFDSSASGFAGPVTISWSGHTETLNAGQKKLLTLPVSGATLSYPRADLLTLSARQMLATGGYAGKAVTDQVAFVPAYWQVQQAVDCGADNGFRYADHADSCSVLGAAGKQVNFSVAALDVNGSKLPLDWLKSQQGLTQHVEVKLDNGADETQTGTFGINSQGSTLSQHQFGSKIVGRLGIRIPDWTAQYIPSNDSPLVTKKHNGFVGRTVPASLSVKPIAGDIKDNVVYAAQPQPIEFVTTPVFILKGLDINGNELPSYSGEFAGGLIGNSEIKLDAKLSDSALTLRHSEPNPNKDGSHKLELVSTSLTFLKDQPFSETSLALPLELTINEHDQTKGLTGETNLGSNDDKLRYGFLVLKDTELLVGQPGAMESKLHYYGKDLNTVEQDTTTSYQLDSSTLGLELDINSSSSTMLPTLSLNTNSIKVDAANDKWLGEVSLKGQSNFNWLKPYSKATNELVNPKGQLTISDRKRGNDKVFNRREVVR